MNRFKASIILMGIDWSKAAKFIAENDIKVDLSFFDVASDGYRKIVSRSEFRSGRCVF